MNVNALRTWGIAVGAVLMTGALAIAAMGPEAPQARAETPMVELAQAQAAPASFLVSFRGNGPIARAQAAAARGRTAQAQRQIEAQLARQRAFEGLCFDRFTAGAAEVVLRSCGPINTRERQQWLARLRAMRAVAYADVNATAAQDRAPG